MTDTASIEKLIHDAHCEPSGEKARRLMLKALALTNNFPQKSEIASLLQAQIHADLAIEEQVPMNRTHHWTKSLHILQNLIDKGQNQRQRAIDMFSIVAVDCFVDKYACFNHGEHRQILRRAIKNTDLGLMPKDEYFHILLTRKASILRQLATFELTPRTQLKTLETAHRCAQLSLKNGESSGNLLEFGLCEWALSRLERSDEKATVRLRNAESIFKKEQTLANEIGFLNLARFYRLTYRPLDACQSFVELIDKTSFSRRLLRDSYVYAEAATQLWFSNFPKATFYPHLSESRRLLETGISAGYRNARMVIDLAFVVAALEGPPKGLVIFENIRSGKSVNWNQLAKLVTEADTNDLVKEGFSLGIDHSAVWTRFGTFVRRCLNNDELSEILYRAAVRLNPRDPIALTNLARQIIEHKDENSLAEARRLISTAQNFADRRFIWWRYVLDDIENYSDHRHDSKMPSPNSSNHQAHLKRRIKNYRDVRQEFRRIEMISNHDERGLELQRLLFEVCRINFAIAAPPYQLSRINTGVIRQIDGFISHGGHSYRIECKWSGDRVNQNDVVIFRNKLDVAGISGLFVSMSGFKDTAISVAKEKRDEKPILLVDGDEARAIFEGHIRFDELISFKRQYFDRMSEPYAKFSEYTTFHD